MKTARFAAWLSTGPAFATDRRAHFADQARRSGLVVEETPARMLVATVPGCAAANGRTVLVGETLLHGSSRPLPPGEALAVLGSEAVASAVERIWGNYILLDGSDADRTSTVRKSPFGSLSCFWARRGDALVCASSLALLQAFGVLRPAIDWRETLLYLIATELRRGSTCLAGVHELPGGHILRLSGGEPSMSAHWSPWRFAGGNEPLCEPADAAEQLAAAIELAVAARTANAERSILLLSGGLDSSVVAAALAKAGRHFEALNLVTRERSGDERVYARAVAEHLHVPLTEVSRSTRGIDWADDTPSRLPRPAARVFRQPALAAARELAARTGARLTLDGGGGDNLFCSLQSVAPVLDRIRLEGLRGGWSTAREIAMLCDVDLMTVARRAATRFLSGRVRFRWLLDHSFLAPDAGDLSLQATEHPWLDPPKGALPGQAAHVALVLAAASVSESLDGEAEVPVLSPLVAQPVAETALRVRSWLWFDRGRNRAIVRRAFAGRLPETVLRRQGKGTPAGFMAEIVAQERQRLRELLLDGLLVRNGIADRTALEAYLAYDGPPLDFGFARVLQLADAELWARSWG